MSNDETGTTPNEATRAEEAKEAGGAHVADRQPTPEEDAAAPEHTGPGVSEHYKEMQDIGAADKGEGRLP